MEVEQYKSRLKEIEQEFEKQKKALYKEFGLAQAKFKKGDMIKDTRGIILIDSIRAFKSWDLPGVVYSGVLLKKDLTPNKKGERMDIYTNDRVELIKTT